MSNWYADSRQVIKAIYGKDWQLFCGLLAATSPNATVKANASLARKAYNQLKIGGIASLHGYLPCHISNIKLFVETGKLSGEKVNSFYQALIGNESAITIDRWIMRAYGLPGEAPTKAQYQDISNRLSNEAKDAGLTNSQYQATVWEKIRGNKGSFADELRQLRLF